MGKSPGYLLFRFQGRSATRPKIPIVRAGKRRPAVITATGYWKHLQACTTAIKHAETVYWKLLQREGLDFTVLQGAYIEAEMNNFGCPWGGGVYSEVQLELNKKRNLKKIQRLVEWAQRYPNIIISLSVGNECCVDWSGNYVPVQKVIEYARIVKAGAKQPVTFCENYVPWLNKLKPLVEVIDFISIHTYPVWEYKHIHEALDYTKENYNLVANQYPDKACSYYRGWAGPPIPMAGAFTPKG
jgi:hypothetical protein